MGARKGVAHPLAHLLAVLAVGEVVEVPIVEVAGARGPLAWLGAHLAGVNAAFPQKLAVGHREGLADGLSNELGLWRRGSSSQGVSHPPSGPPNPLTSSESNPPTHLGQDSQETAYMDFGKIATVLGNRETGLGQGRFRDSAPSLTVLREKREYVGPIGGMERPASTEDQARAGGFTGGWGHPDTGAQLLTSSEWKTWQIIL